MGLVRNMGGFEWLIILALALLLFGVGRVSKVGRELGSAISEFRKGLREGKDISDDETTDET